MASTIYLPYEELESLLNEAEESDNFNAAFSLTIVENNVLLTVLQYGDTTAIVSYFFPLDEDIFIDLFEDYEERQAFVHNSVEPEALLDAITSTLEPYKIKAKKLAVDLVPS